MSQYIVTDDELASVADAIRHKGGTQAGLVWPTEFVSAVNAIETGGVIVPKTITENGTYNASDDNADGYSPVVVNVAGGGGRGNILSGVDEPIAAQGNDGAVYFRYLDNRSLIAQLPSEATLLDYIESSGTQWLNTGIAGNTSGLVVSLIVQALRPDYQGYFGNAWATNGFFLMIDDGRWKFHSGGTTMMDGYSTSDFDILKLEINKFTVNGFEYTFTGGGNQSGVLRVLDNFGSTYGMKAYARLKSVQIYANDTCLADYVPVLDGNNVVCMYDLISEQYIYNSGTGNFIAGPSLIDGTILSTYAKVNNVWQDLIGTDINDIDLGNEYDNPFALKYYIKSDGAQWIDTGYYPNGNTTVEAVAECADPQYTSWPTIFGMRPQAYSSSGCQDLLIHFYDTTSRATWYSMNKGVATTQYLKGSNTKAVYTLGKKGYGITTETYANRDFSGLSEPVGNTYSLFLFAMNNMGSPDNGTWCIMKLYRVRIWENDTLLHEFIPWEDNGVACMKDTVTGDLKYNLGTGSFVYGQDS